MTPSSVRHYHLSCIDDDLSSPHIFLSPDIARLLSFTIILWIADDLSSPKSFPPQASLIPHPLTQSLANYMSKPRKHVPFGEVRVAPRRHPSHEQSLLHFGRRNES